MLKGIHISIAIPLDDGLKVEQEMKTSSASTYTEVSGGHVDMERYNLRGLYAPLGFRLAT